MLATLLKNELIHFHFFFTYICFNLNSPELKEVFNGNSLALPVFGLCILIYQKWNRKQVFKEDLSV